MSTTTEALARLDGWIRMQLAGKGDALDDIATIRAALEEQRPRQSHDGTTHWERCYETRYHHDCALREIERLQAKLERVEGLVDLWAMEGIKPPNDRLGYGAALERCARELREALSRGDFHE